jgi:hypothetical protein
MASPTAPTAPAAPASPTATIDVTYFTNDRTTDPDHFALRICQSGSRDCRNALSANPAAREPGSIKWTGALAPGTYTAMVELWYPDRSIDITFGSAPGSSSGGVVPSSLRFKESNTSPVNVYAYRPCGVTTSFTRRPDLALSNVAQMYVTFEFDVSAASPKC